MKLLQTSFRSPLSRTTSRKGSCNSCTTVCRPAEWGSLKAPQERYVSQHPLCSYHYYHGYTVQAGRIGIFESHRNGMTQHPLFLYHYYHGYTVQAGRVGIFESHRNGMTQHPLFSYHYYHGYTVQAGRGGIFESPTGMVCLNIMLVQSHSFHNMVTWLVQ